MRDCAVHERRGGGDRGGLTREEHAWGIVEIHRRPTLLGPLLRDRVLRYAMQAGGTGKQALANWLERAGRITYRSATLGQDWAGTVEKEQA